MRRLMVIVLWEEKSHFKRSFKSLKKKFECKGNKIELLFRFNLFRQLEVRRKKER